MIKEFVSYEMALALKELGFNEPCFYQYVRDYDECGELIPIVSETNYPILRNNTEVSDFSGGDCFAAPTFSQAFRWFLKKHKLYAVIIPTITMDWTYLAMTVVENMIEVPPYKNVKAYDYSIKEEAEQACLLKLIEIVKKK